MKIELNETNIKIICKLNYFFNDFKKVVKWLETDNINFCNMSPLYFIDIKGSNIVLRFIETALDENGKIE